MLDELRIRPLPALDVDAARVDILQGVARNQNVLGHELLAEVDNGVWPLVVVVVADLLLDLPATLRTLVALRLRGPRGGYGVGRANMTRCSAHMPQDSPTRPEKHTCRTSPRYYRKLWIVEPVTSAAYLPG